MHRNLNNQSLDERNLKPLPITIESCQKEHLYIPKKRPTRGGSSTSHRGSIHATQKLSRTKQQQNKPEKTPQNQK